MDPKPGGDGYAYSSQTRDRDRDGWGEHGARPQYGSRRPHAEPCGVDEARRMASDDRRVSDADAAGMDGAIDRLVAGHPSGDGFQHPQARQAAGPDRVGHQHQTFAIRIHVEHLRTCWQDADPGEVGDVVATNSEEGDSGRRNRPWRFEPSSDRGVPSLRGREMGSEKACRAAGSGDAGPERAADCEGV